MVNLHKFRAFRDSGSLVSIFFSLCQILFTFSILGKVAALDWNSQAYIKPDFILDVPQTTVMEVACLLEFLIVVLLGTRKIGTPAKLGLLLAISTVFITYHVWAWVQGVPTCPCMGDLIPKSIGAKVSLAAAILLLLTSAYLLVAGEGRPRLREAINAGN